MHNKLRYYSWNIRHYHYWDPILASRISPTSIWFIPRLPYSTEASLWHLQECESITKVALSRRCGIIESKPSDSATAEIRGLDQCYNTFGNILIYCQNNYKLTNQQNIFEYCFSSIFPYSNMFLLWCSLSYIFLLIFTFPRFLNTAIIHLSEILQINSTSILPLSARFCIFVRNYERKLADKDTYLWSTNQ